jgi:hypothetical protein
LISLHALVLLTVATLVLELQVAHEQAAERLGERRHMIHTVLSAMKNAVLHPVPVADFDRLDFTLKQVKSLLSDC